MDISPLHKRPNLCEDCGIVAESGLCPTCSMRRIGAQNSAVKYDQGKPDYSLIPPEAMDELAKLYTFGASKYSPRNWEKGLAPDRVFAALQRHAWAWKSGEALDKETGLHHMASVAWCAFALVTYYKRGAESEIPAFLRRQP